MAKQKAWISLALTTVLLTMAASSARGEAYAEFYLGGLQLFFDGVKLEEFSYPDGQIDHTQAISRTEYLDINQAVVFGLRAGTWFVPGGFLGRHYPPWMRYFGCYLDVSCHRLDFSRDVDSTPINPGGAPLRSFTENKFFSEGIVWTLAFMACARYGFFANDQVPSGRLQPYLGVGPGLFIMDQGVTIHTRSYRPKKNTFTPYADISPPRSQTSVTVCLVTDVGLRWMFNRRLSLDFFFRYRFAQPSFAYDYTNPLSQKPTSFTMKPVLHLYSFNLGLAYHF